MSSRYSAPTDLEARLKRLHGFYWTEGVRGLGWAPDAIPTLKNGSTIGIASPPAILLPWGEVMTPDIRDAERLQGFAEDWTLPAESVSLDLRLRWSLDRQCGHRSRGAMAWPKAVTNRATTSSVRDLELPVVGPMAQSCALRRFLRAMPIPDKVPIRAGECGRLSPISSGTKGNRFPRAQLEASFPERSGQSCGLQMVSRIAFVSHLLSMVYHDAFDRRVAFAVASAE